MQKQTRMVQRQNITYITDVMDGSVLGYKYFDFDSASQVLIELRGQFNGQIQVDDNLDGTANLGKADIQINNEDWQLIAIPATLNGKNKSIYFKFTGNGKLDVKTIGFI